MYRLTLCMIGGNPLIPRMYWVSSSYIWDSYECRRKEPLALKKVLQIQRILVLDYLEDYRLVQVPTHYQYRYCHISDWSYQYTM